MIGNGEVVDNGYDSGALFSGRWDDLSVPATRARRGANDKPDFDYTNIGLLFPQNDEDEKIYLVIQMLHAKKLGTQISPHIHYIQESATKPTFIMQYRFYNNGGAVPGSWITIDTSQNNKGIFTYPGSGKIMQIGLFPRVAAPTSEILSANIDIIIYRKTGDGLAGDCLVKFFDVHIEKDADGSTQELIK